MVNSFENPVVYRNVQQDGMNRKKLLPGTGEIDISLATFIGDLDFDGYNEIVLGTYGKVFHLIDQAIFFSMILTH